MHDVQVEVVHEPAVAEGVAQFPARDRLGHGHVILLLPVGLEIVHGREHRPADRDRPDNGACKQDAHRCGDQTEPPRRSGGRAKAAQVQPEPPEDAMASMMPRSRRGVRPGDAGERQPPGHAHDRRRCWSRRRRSSRSAREAHGSLDIPPPIAAEEPADD